MALIGIISSTLSVPYLVALLTLFILSYLIFKPKAQGPQGDNMVSGNESDQRTLILFPLCLLHLHHYASTLATALLFVDLFFIAVDSCLQSRLIPGNKARENTMITELREITGAT